MPTPPAPRAETPETANGGPSIAVPLRLVTEAGTLSLLSTTMVFGTPLDVFISELAIETFLPADAATADALRTLLSAWRCAGPVRTEAATEK